MADRPLDGAAGHATHLSLGPSEDEAMEMRDVHDDPPPEEKDENAHIPWIEVTSRSQRRKMQQLPTTTPLKPALRQSHVARKPKTLPLPADDYKLAIRPRNGLQLSKVSPMDLTKAIAREANLRCGIAEIKIRIDEEQNVLIVSTPSPATAAALNSIKKLTIGNNTFEVSSYGVSPDNACKGEVQEAIVAPNHELLTCRRMGNTGTFLLTFKGKKRRPTPTASKACPQRFLPPVNRRKASPRLHDPRRNQDRSRPDPKRGRGGSRGPDRGSSGCRLRSESKSRASSEAVPQAPREETEKAPKTPRHRCIGDGRCFAKREINVFNYALETSNACSCVNAATHSSLVSGWPSYLSKDGIYPRIRRKHVLADFLCHMPMPLFSALQCLSLVQISASVQGLKVRPQNTCKCLKPAHMP
ncbi:hypothetical protein HPB48_020335 [Haemaphysalis longicornis]|uniref:Uncharacterized protein n=1 Tax=Haemaphysalis longicornis TaxID=44386 RepID=A0A9J6GPX4_HAELO|nr:hypothetical protein HPB48_020335 [Haemaphysalis longicornis]